MRIALVQPKIFEDISFNLDHALEAMEDAAQSGASLICFPELQFSPFFPQYSQSQAEPYLFPIDHKFIQRLRKKCHQPKLIAVPNFYLLENNRHYDASPVIDTDGTISGISKMVHVVQAACFYEQDYYDPAEDGFHVYKTSVGSIGVVICFDRHFPESIRTCTLKGAQLILIPAANTRSEPMQAFEWEVRVAAMQNGVFIAMCNRVGVEGEMDFAGESLVAGPDGELVAKAGDTEQILLADIDLAKIEIARRQRPYLDLRRPDQYELMA
jgi:predicted amidohydrolase